MITLTTEEFLRLIRLLDTYQNLVEELGSNISNRGFCVICKVNPAKTKYCGARCRNIGQLKIKMLKRKIKRDKNEPKVAA